MYCGTPSPHLNNVTYGIEQTSVHTRPDPKSLRAGTVIVKACSRHPAEWQRRIHCSCGVVSTRASLALGLILSPVSGKAESAARYGFPAHPAACRAASSAEREDRVGRDVSAYPPKGLAVRLIPRTGCNGACAINLLSLTLI